MCDDVDYDMPRPSEQVVSEAQASGMDRARDTRSKPIRKRLINAEPSADSPLADRLTT